MLKFYLKSSAQGAAGRFWNFSASLRVYVCRIDKKAVAGGTMFFDIAVQVIKWTSAPTTYNCVRQEKTKQKSTHIAE